MVLDYSGHPSSEPSGLFHHINFNGSVFTYSSLVLDNTMQIVCICYFYCPWKKDFSDKEGEVSERDLLILEVADPREAK